MRDAQTTVSTPDGDHTVSTKMKLTNNGVQTDNFHVVDLSRATMTFIFAFPTVDPSDGLLTVEATYSAFTDKLLRISATSHDSEGREIENHPVDDDGVFYPQAKGSIDFRVKDKSPCPA